MKPMVVGVVGCGNISAIYLKNMTTVFSPWLTVKGGSDLIAERSANRAREFGFKQMTNDELFSDPEIELVVNLTNPQSHYEVCRLALENGKHVYVEKPLSVELEQGRALQKLAQQKGLMLGGAPDTFLGAGLQTCRKIIDDGLIGTPIAATAAMTCHGHESWHPDPEFYYKIGGGPMFDMGPYYITALCSLIGPVKKVSGMTRITFPTRTITSQPKSGQIIDVEVPTHVQGLLQFENGALATLITSFDVWGAHLPNIEIYGTLGTLRVPDPNNFDGEPLLKVGTGDWQAMPLTHEYSQNSRGLGVREMAIAAREGRLARNDGQLTGHVLEVMHAIHTAAREGREVAITPCTRPEALPPKA
nr:Gfo/Idh/MocA family oxidoreductase [bacterium]